MTINSKNYSRLVSEQIKSILAEYADIAFPEHFERRLPGLCEQPSFLFLQCQLKLVTS